MSSRHSSRLALLALGTLALAACRGVSEKRKLDPEAQLDLYVTTATYLYEDGSLVRAQDQAVKALELDPENEAMRRMIGWIRVRQGGPRDLVIAEEFFRKLLRDGDDTQATVLGLATTLERLGAGHDQASKDFASGARTPPDGADPEEKAREMADRARDLYQEAYDLYSSTLVDGAGSVRTMNGLQRVSALLGRYEESLDWSAQLLAQSEAELADWRRMLEAEDLTQSEEDLLRTNEEEALQLQLDTHLFAATLAERLDHVDDAIDHLDAVAALDPDRSEIYGRRAQLRARRGDFQGAIEDLDRFLRLTELSFEDADVQHAFELRAEYEAELVARAQ